MPSISWHFCAQILSWHFTRQLTFYCTKNTRRFKKLVQPSQQTEFYCTVQTSRKSVFYCTKLLTQTKQD